MGLHLHLKLLYNFLVVYLGLSCVIIAQGQSSGELTAEELLTKANQAFQGRDFKAAEDLFIAFERDFGEEPGFTSLIQKNSALIALCMISNGKGFEASPYIEKALAYSDLPLDVKEELAFWDAVGKLKATEYRTAQEAFGRFFQERRFTYERRLESLTLFGTCYLLQGYFHTAAEFFNHQIPNLRRAPGGHRFASRAVVMMMMSLIESRSHDQALHLLVKEYPNLDQLTQVISFQTLALNLGSQYMAEGDYYKAITALQRIWSKRKLIEHQQVKLTELQTSRDAMQQDPRMHSTLFQVNGTIKRVERELENFQSIENFDAALRLRLALAFQSLKRYREAALIMEDMLQHMDKSPVLESASLALIQCWSQLNRWPKALHAADNYLQAFGDDSSNPNLPRVLFMQADAMMQMAQLANAEGAFDNLHRSFPNHRLAPKALFMRGFCQLQQNLNVNAIATFDAVYNRDVDLPSLKEDAFYWKGMAYSFQQKYEQAFHHMDNYLKTYRNEAMKYESEAAFRMAYCTFCQADYPTAIKKLRTYLANYGTTAPDYDEAQLLLGDALLGEGEVEAGIAAYASINSGSRRFFEDGYFKTGKAYKLLQEIPDMRGHYQAFITAYPDSKRMPEAVYWIGWSHVHENDIDLAKQAYWTTIKEHGNKPDLFSIEELLIALPKVYKRGGPKGEIELTRDLREIYIESDRNEQTTLAIRALWADAMLKQQRGKQGQSFANLIRIDSLIDPEIHNPQIIADVADALVTKNELERAKRLYQELRKWNPISIHKAEASRGLGMIAEMEGDHSLAIDHYKDYERQSANSSISAEITLQRISLQLAEGETAHIQADLDALLESPTTSSESKAHALYLMGETLARSEHYEKATAYFERVYVVYGRYRELVAKSYYRRGEMLEKLGSQSAAYQVYAELAKREDLKSFRESSLGRRKADRLESYAQVKHEQNLVKEATQ